MPRGYALEMSRREHDQLQPLSRRFGGYATQWLKAAGAFLACQGVSA
jgi:hypothetical protein